MKSLSDLAKGINLDKYRRKDFERRSLIDEFFERLNADRARENEEKITKYKWEKQVSRTEAIKALLKTKDPARKIYKPITVRAIVMKVIHLNDGQLRDFLDMCNQAEKDERSFSKCFFGNLKIKK